MASLLDTLECAGYKGPYAIDPDTIKFWVEQGRIGTYLLAVVLGAEGDTFNISYIGRSDTDLAARLQDHAYDILEDTFWFKYHETPQAAYEEELQLYKVFRSTLRNERRPAKP